MTIEEIFIQFSKMDGILPKETMQWSLDHWEEVWPAFLTALEDRTLDGLTNEDPRFFMVHLAGHMHERRAHSAICGLVLDADTVHKVIGGTTTGGLNGILINTFDGAPEPLMSVIEAEHADELVRSAALDALTYIHVAGQLDNFDMQSYIHQLSVDLKPREDCYVWTAWAEAVARLGYEELVGTYHDLLDSGLIHNLTLRPDEFSEVLANSKARGPATAFAMDRVQPYGNTIETLSGWYAFSPAVLRDVAQDAIDDGELVVIDEDLAEEWESGEQAVNVYRHVGRNDPCPCGSGKKFKKCCLSSLQ